MNFLKILKVYFSSKRKLMKELELLKGSRKTEVSVINKQEKEDDIWHLIVYEDGKEMWIRPKHVTYIGPIIENVFEFIIDGNKTTFTAKTIEEAKQIRNIILNIESIPTANTYDTSKESSDYIDQQLKCEAPKRMTQEDVDALNIRNKSPVKKSLFQKIFRK